MPYVKEWIAVHGAGWLEKLVEQYKLKAPVDNGRVSLHYTIDTPMQEPIALECRGMVVSLEGKILAHPYNKFWNLGEKQAAPIDWATARVQEKLDGSLAILYHADGAWWFASSGTPMASGNYGSSALTFRDVFWKTFTDTGMMLPGLVCQDIGFFFELCAPDNRIIVQYEEPQLILHGARNRVTEEELSRTELALFAAEFNWPLVRDFMITSLSQTVEVCDRLNPLEQEGFVVVDGNFNRVKIKNPRYVVLHKMKGEATEKRAIELFQAGQREIDEVLAYFPEFKNVIDPVLDRIYALATFIAGFWEVVKDLPDRKTFAMSVKDTPFSAVLFKLYGKGEGAGVSRSVEEVVSHLRGVREGYLVDLVLGGSDPAMEAP